MSPESTNSPMPSRDPRLIYVNVPKHCEEAVPLLDLGVRAFAKTVKRMMKRLDKGATSIEKSIPRVTSTGFVEHSGYTLVTDQTEASTGFIFARLPGASGDNQVHQLSFTRFSIKKDGADDEVDSSVANSAVSTAARPAPQESIVMMEETLQQFSRKLDDLNSSITVLSASMQSPQRCPPTPLPPITIPFNGKSVKRRSPVVTAPDCEFMSRVDATIDRVLRRINKDKDVQTIKEMNTLYSVHLYEALRSDRQMELQNTPFNAKPTLAHTPKQHEVHSSPPTYPHEPASKKRKLNKSLFPLTANTTVDMDHCS